MADIYNGQPTTPRPGFMFANSNGGNTGIVPPGTQAAVQGQPQAAVLSATQPVDGGPVAPQARSGGALPPTPAPPPQRDRDLGTLGAVRTPMPGRLPRPPDQGVAMGGTGAISGRTLPGVPRPPSLPAGTAYTQQPTTAQGMPTNRSRLLGRPGGGLFPRLG